jgi:hypothetical protein
MHKQGKLVLSEGVHSDKKGVGLCSHVPKSNVMIHYSLYALELVSE